MTCNKSNNDLVVKFANEKLGMGKESAIDESCNLGMSTLLGYNFTNKCPPNGEFIETVGAKGCDTYLNANMNASIKPYMHVRGAWSSTPPFISPSNLGDWIGGSLNPSINFDTNCKNGTCDGFISNCGSKDKFNYNIDIGKTNIDFSVRPLPPVLTNGQIDFSINGGVSGNMGVSLPIDGNITQNYKTNCQRVAYTAPPLYGCINELQNKSKSDSTMKVFDVLDSEGNKTYRTLDPQFISSSDSCSQSMSSFCSNDSIFNSQYKEFDNTDFKQWNKNTGTTIPPGVCYTYATQNGSPDGRASVITSSLEAINKKWPISTYPAWKSNPVAVSAWKGILSAIKTDKSSAGSYALDGVCNVNGISRDTIKNLPKDDLRWQACACHLPSDQYSSFLGIIDQGYYHACDPVCSVASLNGEVVGQYSDGNLVTCKQNNCIIDNTTINILNSNQGNINFDQVCGSSGWGSTTCYIKDLSVFEQASQNGDINIAQNCGSCFIGSEEVDCSTGEALTWWGRIKQFFNKKNIIIISIILIIILLLIIFYFRLSSKTNQQEYSTRMEQISALKSI